MLDYKIRIYIAAPFEAKAIARQARTELEAANYEITSRWIDKTPPADPELIIAYKQEEAIHDVEDVYAADALILLNSSKSEGKAVETGLALAWKRPVIIVGERTNIFHHLPIPTVPDVAGAITILKDWEAQYEKARAEAIAAQLEPCIPIGGASQE